VFDPYAVNSELELENLLSEPYEEDIQAVRSLEGGVILLGAGGKMGPTLARRVAESFRRAGRQNPVVAVSRFGNREQRQRLEESGVRTIAADLLEDAALDSLPRLPNVIYMAGTKFGTSGNEALTWAMNSYLPGRIAERFRSSRIVAFSTGNVYSLLPVDSGGPAETDPVGPAGEYAQSCLGRERVLEYFSVRYSIPACLLRLNYAVEPRYGVLLDIAQRVFEGKPVSLEMGYVNVIWQGDANSVCLRAFQLCGVPPAILNLTGAETLSVRALAEGLGRRLDRTPVFSGSEGPTALLSDARRCRDTFGPPKVGVENVLDLVAHWVRIGGTTLGKPTKFEVRDGKF
jgi:nucleoside-diphosphate-sugar epimerase